MGEQRRWTPLMLLAQINRFRRQGQCPTIEELARDLDLPIDQVQQLLDVLIDRRYVVVDCGRVYPWEAGPSPVVTYKLSPEEIAARYGPPTRRRTKAGNHHAEEAAEMPKGIYIDWPSNEQLVAMADEIAARGGNVVDELSERIGCSPFTIKKRLRLARLERLRESTDAPPAAEKPDSAAAPSPSLEAVADAEPPADSGASQAGEPETAPEPYPGELMQMAEQEATRLVEAARSQHGPGFQKSGTSTHPETESGLTEAQDASTARTLVLLGVCTPESLPAIIMERECADRAPERPGDEWAELVRINGRRTYRLWRCVAVLPDGAAVLIPVDAAIVQAESVAAARTA